MTKSKKVREREHKASTWYTKTVDEDEGIVEHIITVFGVIDYGKDRSHPGSFTKTLAERAPHDIRVLDMHNTQSILDIVGKPLGIKEISRDELPAKLREDFPEATGAVLATTKFFLDTPEGKGAFIRIKEDTVEWSYGYDALDVDEETVKHNGEEIAIRNLRGIKLYEYGPVLFGMVPGTTTLSAKDVKPAPDIQENTIRIRVRDPGDFDKETFKTISIGPEDNGIQAVVGKLKDNGDAMVVQSYVFDKEKFDAQSAQAWVDEHGKSLSLEEGQEEEPKELEITDDVAYKIVYNLSEEDKTRFWEMVDKSGDDWLWTGAKSHNGYGLFKLGGKVVKAHRVSFSMSKGDIPEEKVICHSCRVAACVRPGHLSLCTTTDNNQPEKAEDAVMVAVLLRQLLSSVEPDSVEAQAIPIAVDRLEQWYGEKTDEEIRELEIKAGRVLAGRNAARIGSALTELIAVLQDAGIQVDGLPVETVVDEDNGKEIDWSVEIAQAELELMQLRDKRTPESWGRVQ